MTSHRLATLALRLAEESSRQWAPMVLVGGALSALLDRGERDPVLAAFLRNERHGRTGPQRKRGGECRSARYLPDGGAMAVGAASGQRPKRLTALKIGTTRRPISV